MSQTTARQQAPPVGPTDSQVEALLDELAVSPQSNLIATLQDVQDRFGYLPPIAIHEISRRTNTRLSRVYGVVSFYAQFYTRPRGRHTIRHCRGTACYVCGGDATIDAIANLLGIEDGETTEDMMFTFETVACLGACALSPVIVLDGVYYGKITPHRAEAIVRKIIKEES